MPAKDEQTGDVNNLGDTSGSSNLAHMNNLNNLAESPNLAHVSAPSEQPSATGDEGPSVLTSLYTEQVNNLGASDDEADSEEGWSLTI